MTAQLLNLLTYLLIGFGLVLVVEGLAYAVFPGGIKRLMLRAQELPVGALRTGGLLAAIAGLGLLWLIQQ